MMGITIRKALDDYKTVYMPYRNFAERTREEYLNDLQDLAGFLEKAGINHVREIGLPIIERYGAHLEQKGFASLTRKRKVVAIRSFLSFLYQDGYIDTNITKRVVLPFTENTTPYVLTGTECNRLRLACAGSPRDRAIIELLLQTGVKLSELIILALNDIEIGEKNTGFIRILGSRGKKERLILTCPPKTGPKAMIVLDRLGGRNNSKTEELYSRANYHQTARSRSVGWTGQEHQRSLSCT